jgi:hypothetical protein
MSRKLKDICIDTKKYTIKEIYLRAFIKGFYINTVAVF